MELTKVLEALLEQGKITKQDIVDIIGVSTELTALTDILHTILCHRNHDTECNYAQEELFEDTWKAVDHLKWIEKTKSFLEALNMNEADGLAAAATAVNLIRNNAEPVLSIIAEYVNAQRDHVPAPPEPCASVHAPEPSQNISSTAATSARRSKKRKKKSS